MIYVYSNILMYTSVFLLNSHFWQIYRVCLFGFQVVCLIAGTFAFSGRIVGSFQGETTQKTNQKQPLFRLKYPRFGWNKPNFQPYLGGMICYDGLIISPSGRKNRVGNKTTCREIQIYLSCNMYVHMLYL